MKLFNPLISLLAILPASSYATECGQWYSNNCVCDTDIRYCPDGTNGASDNIKDQHPFWKDYEGHYSYVTNTFSFGLYPAVDPQSWLIVSPTKGYMNATIAGSRTYNHRFNGLAPNPNANCSNPAPTWNGKCGVNGRFVVFEGFGTSTPERDGTAVTTTTLSPIAGGDPSMAITDENAEYKQVPIDDNTLFGSAKSELFFVAETFSFTNNNKTEASAVTDVYMTVNEVTTLVSSYRTTFTKLDNEQQFVDGVLALYEEFNIMEEERMDVPMTKTCNQLQLPCPTEEDFCAIDPRCSASVEYLEPDATVEAGPIVGIVVAVFVVFFAIMYYLHLRAMAKQAARNQAVFARRIAETIKLEGPDRTLTPEALAEEFKKIDNGNVDGSIDKEELWNFLNTGNSVKMNKSDFNALFSALDTDGDGTVSFMEFSAYMGKAYEDFNTMKDNKSVRDLRGAGRMDGYYSGISTRMLSIANETEKKEVDKMEEIAEKDEENA